nr:hypothetical protein [Tanacetum cinerariifolium]
MENVVLMSPVNDEMVNKQNCEKDKTDKKLKDRTEICYKDKKNNVTKGTKFVNVEYAWKPPMCAECKVFGHEVGKCKAQKGNKHQCSAESNIVDKEGFTNVQKSNKNVHNVNGLQNNRRDQHGWFGRKVKHEFRPKGKVKRVREGKYAQEEEE